MDRFLPGHSSAASLVEEGGAKMRSGERVAARELLERAVALDPGNEQAWLWLAAAVETAYERRRCLERVLAINPANQETRRQLQALEPVTPTARITRPITAPLPAFAPEADQVVLRPEPVAPPAPAQPPGGPPLPYPVQAEPPVAMPVVTAAPVAGPSYNAPPFHSWLPLGRARLRAIPAVLYALILMVFLLPFVTVSCGSMRQSYSGIDLMSKNVEIEAAGWLAGQLGRDLPQLEGASARMPAMGAFAAAVIALIGALLPHWSGRALAGTAGVGGALMLLMLRSVIDRQLQRPPFETLVVLSYEAGYWAALMLFALASAFSLLLLYGEVGAHARSRGTMSGPWS